MSEAHIQRDMAYLAGELLHRGSNTESERSAAEYLKERFGAYAADTEIDDFAAIDSCEYVFASYYAESLIVSLAAFWFPRVALCYGAMVFLAYLSEFMGYRVFSRFLPHFETQNVMARFLAPRPKRLVIVTAHYDSGRESVFAAPKFLPWLRAAHEGVVVCMLVVLLTCAIQGAGILGERALYVALAARWLAVAALLAASAALFYSAAFGDFVRGANANASGVAALSALAERIVERPFEESDVWLVATGSDETWMSGMRRLVTTHAPDRDTTYFLNIEHVGAGALHYTTGEGMLSVLSASSELVGAAGAVADQYHASACRLRAVPGSALVPLTRGYKGMSIVRLGPDGTPQNWRRHTDTLVHADYVLIKEAAQFAEAVLRCLESGPRTDGAPLTT